ncbi:hypothetical protein TB2_027078 [Malus domestica]
MPSQTPATLPNSAGNSDNNTEQKAPQCLVREQDRYMPIANVIRIMRKILPPHAKISDDAKETMQESVSEYIAFITGEANERCQREQRKTVTAEDVLWAMGKLGFDNYVEPLTIYLRRYRESESSDRSQFVTREEPQLMDYCPPGHAGPQVAMMPPPPPSYGPENYFGPQHGPPMYDPSMMGMFRDGSSSGAGGGGSSSASGAQAWLQSEFSSFEFKDKLVPLDGIKSATVLPIEGQAAVNYIPELINARKIKEAVEDAGFPVSEFPQQDVAVCGLRIKGMACTSCSESVECALRMVDGVKNAVAGLALEEAKVHFDLNLTDTSCIIQGIEDAGFGAELVAITYDKDLTGPRSLIRCIEEAGRESKVYQASLYVPPRPREAERKREIQMYRNQFFLSYLFSVPIFSFSMVLPMVPPYGNWLDYKVHNSSL